MLTADYEVLGVRARDLVLDIGCGAGRHSFEALRRGAHTVSADLDDAVLKDVRDMAGAMVAAAEAPPGTTHHCAAADATQLPFGDATFDRAIASEVLEHVPEDTAAMKEIARVVKPGGIVVVTVPRRWPERICWSLSSAYTASAGGHVRIYSGAELRAKLGRSGLTVFAAHHAHALHTPYWWLKCLVGVDDDDALLPRLYHAFLVWQITHRSRIIEWAERVLNPLLGKSLAVYARKPVVHA